MTFELLKCTDLDDPMVVGPGYFETIGQLIDGTCAGGTPDHEAYGGGAEITDNQGKILHSVRLPAGARLLLTEDWMQVNAMALIRVWNYRKGRRRATLLGMDSVRFGRALGVGARAAAKTLVTAVDAATSPNPSAGAAQARAGAAPEKATAPGSTTAGRLVDQAAKATAQVLQNKEGLARGGKRFGETVWGNFTKLSGVLWLEFTGVFFGIFALFAATGAWKLRGSLHETAANHEDHVHLLVLSGVAVGFGYFFVSSFLRARRKGRGR